MQIRMAMGRGAFALLLWGVLAGPAALEAQGPDGRWPLQPRSPGNRTLAPFMEGWYANEDGTFSISFGFLNANSDTIRIPLGPDNFIEPAQFDGMQPTVFVPGHPRGLFAVNLPAAMEDTDVWWTLRKANGEVTRVPGRIGAVAYQLDWYPRPHGSMHPLVSFDSQSGEGRGPPGLMAERTETVSVGSPLTLSINTRDPSERDREDFRFREAIALRVVWSHLQGPGSVEYTRHESNPLPEVEEPDSATAAALAAGGATAAAARRRREPPGPEVIPLSEGYGTARVIVTFSEPGEYLMRAQSDNWAATDSGSGDQCCWTNGYVRVNVR
jgi:MYXO-CTERM domain-containing protein